MSKILFATFTLILMFLALGCGKAPTEGEITRPVSITFEPQKALLAASGSVTVGADVVQITAVKMTLEDIDIERSDVSVDCPDGQECSDYFAGPVLLDLNLEGINEPSQIIINVPIGTYDTISFDISVPDGGDPAQEDYLRVNPDMRYISLRIEGFFNDTAFSFGLDLSGDQEIPLIPNLEVTLETTLVEVVIVFDVASWFVRPDGSLMNPNEICSDDVGCFDRTIVERNIEASLESYSNE